MGLFDWINRSPENQAYAQALGIGLLQRPWDVSSIGPAMAYAAQARTESLREQQEREEKERQAALAEANREFQRMMATREFDLREERYERDFAKEDAERRRRKREDLEQDQMAELLSGSYGEEDRDVARQLLGLGLSPDDVDEYVGRRARGRMSPEELEAAADRNLLESATTNPNVALSLRRSEAAQAPQTGSWVPVGGGVVMNTATGDVRSLPESPGQGSSRSMPYGTAAGIYRLANSAAEEQWEALDPVDRMGLDKSAWIGAARSRLAQKFAGEVGLLAGQSGSSAAASTEGFGGALSVISQEAQALGASETLVADLIGSLRQRLSSASSREERDQILRAAIDALPAVIARSR